MGALVRSSISSCGRAARIGAEALAEARKRHVALMTLLRQRP